MGQYPVYFAFEDDNVNAILADIKRNDASGQQATATTGGYVTHPIKAINIFSILLPFK